MSEVIASLVNGETRAHVGIDDRGLQYGDGVFETIVVARGTLLLWDQHLDRMQRGAARLGIAAPQAAPLKSEAIQLCRGVDYGVLKIIISRGSGSRSYAPPTPAASNRMLTLWTQTPPDRTRADTGVNIRLCRTRLGQNPALAGLKHLNRLEQVLARAEWGSDYAEGLMQDSGGDVIEGTMSNLFLVLDGALTTPDLSRCGVEGVMRGIILERAAGLGIPRRVRPVSLDDVQRADELFLTNSVIGVWPVARFEHKEYRVGAVARALQQSVRGLHGGG